MKHGVLRGLVEQPVPQPEIGRQGGRDWFVTAELFKKEESDMIYQHHNTWEEAKQEWSKIVRECKKKVGRSGVLIDCMKLCKVREIGNKEDVEYCLSEAKAAGFYAEKEEKSPSVLDTVLMLYKVLNNTKDVAMLVLVMLLLGISFLMDLELKVLTGLVISVVTTDVVNNTVLEENWYVASSCSIISCSEGLSDLRVRLLLSMVVVGLLERLFYVVNVWFHHNACDKKNRQMQVSSFRHILSLDQSYFDTHCESEIKSFKTGVSAINNLITWNIPYILGLSLQMVLTGLYMLKIDISLGSLAILGFTFIQLFVLAPFKKVERSVHKVGR